MELPKRIILEDARKVQSTNLSMALGMEIIVSDIIKGFDMAAIGGDSTVMVCYKNGEIQCRTVTREEMYVRAPILNKESKI